MGGSATPSQASSSSNPKPKYDCIIIGAGISGLAAANSLTKQGYKTLVVEARNRIGGRIDSRNIGSGKGEGRVDMGASFVHGKYDNPIKQIVDEMQIPLYYDQPDDELVSRDKNGDIPADIAERLEMNIGRAFFSQSREHAQSTDPTPTASLASYIYPPSSPIYHSLPLAHHFQARSIARAWSGWTGANLEDVALRWWGFERETLGPDGMVLGGRYGEVCEMLKGEGVGDLWLKKEVVGVKWDEDAETVTLDLKPTAADNAKPQQISASHVICTLPLGVLKHRPPTFSPPLPPRKQRSIRAVGYGLLSKVVLRYEKAWWDRRDEAPMYFLLPTEDTDDKVRPPKAGKDIKPQAIMVQNLHKLDGTPQLLIFLGADYGEAMEKDSSENSIKWSHNLVKEYLRPKGTNASDIPDPTPGGAATTDWLTDPYSLGSYSYIPPHLDAKDKLPSTPLDMLEFSVPIWGGAFGFAGEHTHHDRYASVHGAYESGLREAKRVGIELTMREEGQ